MVKRVQSRDYWEIISTKNSNLILEFYIYHHLDKIVFTDGLKNHFSVDFSYFNFDRINFNEPDLINCGKIIKFGEFLFDSEKIINDHKI